MKVKMSDVFTFAVIGSGYGILQMLQDSTNYPLLSSILTSANAYNFDIDYHVGNSNEKWCSPLFTKLLDVGLQANGFTLEDLTEHRLTDGDIIAVLDEITRYGGSTGVKLDDIIYNRFGVKWKKLFDAINTQYNPLENYDMTQERTPDLTHEDTYDVTDERTPDITREDTFDTIDERTADLTNTENGTFSKNVNSESSVYGFNSTSANPSGDVDGDETTTITDHTNAETGTDTNTKTGTITNTETGTDTTTKSGTITTTETGTETLTRHGNIGVTTSQQMLESEFEVRKHDFYQIMFNDIDSILCLKIY